MRLFVYDMLVNVNVIYYVHVCEKARLCIIIMYCVWGWAVGVGLI